MIKIKGLAGATGCVSGEAVVFAGREVSVERRSISDVVEEINGLEEARQTYQKSLAKLVEEQGSHGEEQAAILEAYQEILQDDVFFNDVKGTIKNELVCSSFAIELKRIETESLFMELDDEYLKARATDINNVCRELMAEIQGIIIGDPFAGMKGDHLVVFAEDLSPADTVRMDRTRLAGLVTERGGITSHTVILAKALGIPAIVGTGEMLEKVTSGDLVLVDGAAGEVVIQPDEATKEAFLVTQEKADKQKELFEACVTKVALSKDGVRTRVNINSGDKESIALFDEKACDGVGLFRTEFLYMGQTDYPSEDLQYEVYKDMAERTAGKELIIRTLDIGGDKQLDYMDMPKEQNPFLGYRAIRLCLDRVDVFKVQLRAILRASAFGAIKIMFPMIVNLEELLRAKKLVDEAKRELQQKGIAYNKDIKVGIMVETPAAVLLSDVLAKNCDFFSIGSNDLIQYTTATDRQNEGVQYLYDNCNVSFLRAVKMTSESAHKAGIEVGICGETASDPRLIPLWIAMGIDELSVAPGLVGRTKYIISQLNKRVLQDTMEKILASGQIQETKDTLDEIVKEAGL